MMRNGAPLPDVDRRLARLDTLAWWLDDRFRLPGTSIRLGVDGLAGLMPGVGDTATTLLSAWIIVEAWRLGVPRRVLAAMALRVGVDWLIGLVPLAGDLFDIGYKANRRNVDHLRRHFDEKTPRPKPGRQQEGEEEKNAVGAAAGSGRFRRGPDQGGR